MSQLPLGPSEARAGTPVRSAVLALFSRLGVRGDALDPADGLAPGPAPTSERNPAERALRRRARAAHAAVEDNPPIALEAALDVFAEAFLALDRRARHQAEVLKAIQLYAPEPWVRHIARQSLNRPDREVQAFPDFLAGNALDDAELSVMAARYGA